MMSGRTKDGKQWMHSRSILEEKMAEELDGVGHEGANLPHYSDLSTPLKSSRDVRGEWGGNLRPLEGPSLSLGLGD